MVFQILYFKHKNKKYFKYFKLFKYFYANTLQYGRLAHVEVNALPTFSPVDSVIPLQ